MDKRTERAFGILFDNYLEVLETSKRSHSYQARLEGFKDFFKAFSILTEIDERQLQTRLEARFNRRATRIKDIEL